MYDELVKDLRENHDKYFARDMQAADVIEALATNYDAATDIMKHQTEYIEELEYERDSANEAATALHGALPKWIPVTERLPECDLGAEVGNIEWISCGMVHAGCFGRGGKYRDAYFRTWTDSGEGIDAKDADYWRAVTLPEPPKEE